MHSPFRRLLPLALAAAAVLAATGCAFSRSEDKSTIVFTHDLHAPAAPLRKVSVAVVSGRFVDKDGKAVMTALANTGNGHVATLFPALARRLPPVLREAGVQVGDFGVDAPGFVPDARLVLRPESSGEDKFGFHLGIRGELRDAKDALLWSGTVSAQPNNTTPERAALRAFGDAMADDIARTLVDRWRAEGILRPANAAVATR